MLHAESLGPAGGSGMGQGGSRANSNGTGALVSPSYLLAIHDETLVKGRTASAVQWFWSFGIQSLHGLP